MSIRKYNQRIATYNVSANYNLNGRKSAFVNCEEVKIYKD